MPSPVLNKTCEMKTLIGAQFGDGIDFYPSGRNIIVHNSRVNPCEYSLATIKGRGLRDDDIIKAFGAMIRRKVMERKERKKANAETEEKFPFTPDRVLSLIHISEPTRPY